MATFASLGKYLKVASVEITTNASKLVRLGALEIDKRLVLATPVDTGRARSNWLIGINRSRTETEETILSPAGAIARGAATIATSRPGDAIWISNNLDYIDALNRGWSQQAPPGYVDDIVEEVGAGLLKKAELLNK